MLEKVRTKQCCGIVYSISSEEERRCTTYIEDNQKYCDDCIQAKIDKEFKIEDIGYDGYYLVDQVIKMFRKIRKW